MAGAVEDEDPGEDGLVVGSTVVFGDAGEALEFDVEDFTDRLRLMGLDPDLVAEAERRLRLDVGDGTRWLHQRLSEMDPPRKPPSCDCGEPLVDLDWRGSATVRCLVCDSRWGIEVHHEQSESWWRISGPSGEWAAAHPAVEAVGYVVEPEEVLRNGLPPLPADAIEPGSYFPLACWQDEEHAAVLYLHRLEAGEYDFSGDEFEDEIEHLARADDGDWISTGSGGGNWINVFEPPAGVLDKHAVLGTGVSGSATADGGLVSFTGGLCSAQVAAVETSDRTGTKRYEIDPARPFFVVGVYGIGRVRVLGADGRVITNARGRTLEFDLND